MEVKFKFDYVLNLHNKNTYITAIERDGVEEEVAFKRSLVQINKGEIKSITKMSDGTATILFKNNNPSLSTVEDYNEVIDTLQNANIAVDIMNREKVYIFDEFVVDSDELNVVNNWKSLR
jgi:effector-binding domain-containing protein